MTAIARNRAPIRPTARKRGQTSWKSAPCRKWLSSAYFTEISICPAFDILGRAGRVWVSGVLLAAAESQSQQSGTARRVGSRHRCVRPRACEGFRVSRMEPHSTARNQGAIAALARELVATHAVRAKTMPADLSLPGAAEAIASALQEAGIQVGVLVNNAGVIFESDFAGIALDDHLRLLQINVVALKSLTRLFIPPMIKRGTGRILSHIGVCRHNPPPPKSCRPRAPDAQEAVADREARLKGAKPEPRTLQPPRAKRAHEKRRARRRQRRR